MSDLKAAVVRPSELTSEDIARWRSLLSGMPGVAPAFMSYAYALTAERCFTGVRVARLEKNGRVVGFFPFQFRSRIHRLTGIGERISGGLADYFGLVAEPGLRISGRELIEAAGLKSLLFDHLDDTQISFGLVGEQPEPGLRIELADGGAAYWEALRKQDKKFVQDTERRERKLAETHGPLRFVFRQQPAAGLDELIAAKRHQYARTGVHDVMANTSTRRFLKALSSVDDPQCQATFSTLHAGENWVCSHFGLRCADTLHFWFPVYNPDMSAFAPGRLLVKAIIDTSHETGVKLIDRGAGDTKAKRDFATSEHLYYRGVWQKPGLVSLAYRASLSAKWRAQRGRARWRSAHGVPAGADGRSDK